MVYKCFDKKSSGGGSKKNETIPNQQYVIELHTPIIKRFKKCRAYSSFRDDIFISKYNKGVRFLLCIFIFTINTFGLFH